MKTPPRDGSSHRTVTRVTSILEIVSSAEPVGIGLAALTGKLDAPKSSVHGLVHGLLSVGYLSVNQGIYHIGPAPSALLGASRPPVAERARHPMELLRDEIDETVVLNELVGDTFIYASMVEAHQAIHYATPLGIRNALVPMSGGRVFLSTMSDSDIRSYLRKHPELDPDETFADVADIRDRSVAVNNELTVAGLSAVACAIDPGSPARWALSVAGPTDRIMPRLDLIAGKLTKTAADIARLI